MSSSTPVTITTCVIPQQVQQLPFSKLLPTLPKQCLEGRDSSYIYEYKGFWYPLYMLEGVVSVQHQFQALPTDIYICGALKTGNTWLKSLCFAIATRKLYRQTQTDDDHVGDENNNNNNVSPLLSNMSHSLILNIEFEHLINQNRNNHTLLSTHLPYISLPESAISSGCKIIYISREPKDTFVSMFHFIQNFSTNHDDQHYDLDYEVNLFCEGKTIAGPYWDHVLGYHKAGLERPEKFFFLTYEKLKANAVYFVKKLAEFMDQPFSGEEELEGVPEKIVEMCSFKNLKGLESNKMGNKIGRDGAVFENQAFFRKGETSDWKNEITVDMAKKIDRMSEEKFKGSAFSFE